MKLIFGLLTAYLIGSLPTAFLFGKLLKGIDIREAGSGNAGATNVYRTIGKVPGFAVLGIDILKGALPIILIPIIFNIDKSVSNYELYRIVLGLFAIGGHVWSVFLLFKGGKGVATTAGVIAILAPKVVLLALIVWIGALLISRYVSVSSIAAALSLPFFAIVLKTGLELSVFLIVVAIMGVYKHKTNIQRLKNGSEKKIF